MWGGSTYSLREYNSCNLLFIENKFLPITQKLHKKAFYVSHHSCKHFEMEMNGNTTTVNSSNETGVDLPVSYVVLDVTAAVLYLPLVIIPSLILYSFILNFYCKKESSFKTPLDLITVKYCISALLRNVITGLLEYVFVPISLKSGNCIGELILFGLTLSTAVLTSYLIALLAITQCILILNGKSAMLISKKKWLLP